MCLRCSKPAGEKPEGKNRRRAREGGVMPHGSVETRWRRLTVREAAQSG